MPCLIWKLGQCAAWLSEIEAPSVLYFSFTVIYTNCLKNDCILVVFASSGAVLVDQYCNPLADVTLEGISLQIDEIAEKVKKMLRIKNPSHPSLRIANGRFLRITSEKRKLSF